MKFKLPERKAAQPEQTRPAEKREVNPEFPFITWDCFPEIPGTRDKAKPWSAYPGFVALTEACAAQGLTWAARSYSRNDPGTGEVVTKLSVVVGTLYEIDEVERRGRTEAVDACLLQLAEAMGDGSGG